MKIITVSGGFDPIHSGHINYLSAAKKLGDKLIVLLNSDEWLIGKKTKSFLSFDERKIILESMKMVDEVIGFDDDEAGSCINGLKFLMHKYPDDEIIFCNGGDRNKDNIPEQNLKGINFKFGVGGNTKKNSSSSILKKWTHDYEKRTWGTFTELFIDKGIKVKELIINPGMEISFQRHLHRNELWFLFKGNCIIKRAAFSDKNIEEIQFKENESIVIKKNSWHQIINNTQYECRIIEIQFGDKTIESDIERKP